jgi:hypothetical protein
MASVSVTATPQGLVSLISAFDIAAALGIDNIRC